MKKTLLIAVAAAATLATPFAAQAAPNASSARVEMQIKNDIDRGLRNRTINNAEARTFRSQLNYIDRLENQYRRSDRRYTPRERDDIIRRLNSLSYKVKQELRNDRWGRDRDRWNRR